MERGGPAHELRPGEDLDPLDPVVRRGVRLIAHGPLHVDHHAANGIDDPRERLEIDQGVGVQLDPEEVLDDLLREVRPAERVGRVDLVDEDTRLVDPDVPREREHRRGLVHGVERQHDHRVGVVGGRPVAAGVDAEEQHVEALRAAPRHERLLRVRDEGLARDRLEDLRRERGPRCRAAVQRAVEGDKRRAYDGERKVLGEPAPAERADAAELARERVHDHVEVVREEARRHDEREGGRVPQYERGERVRDRDEGAGQQDREDREQDHEDPADPAALIGLAKAWKESRQDGGEAG